MRLVNYVFRFFLFTFICSIVTLFVYLGTIIGMLFIDWNREYESLKTIHIEMYEWWIGSIIGDKKYE